MFGWFKRKQASAQRSMVGDLDLLSRKEFYIRYQGKEWMVPELTAREYAQFCALLAKLEAKTAANEPDKVDEIYEDIFMLTVPSLPKRIVRKMPLKDSHAMFVAILRHYGIDLLNDKEGSTKKKIGKKNQTIF